MRLLALLLALSAPSWGAFTKSFTLKVNAAKVNSDQTNFLLTISLSSTSLKTVANGGVVTSSSGFDIYWYLDAARTQALCTTTPIYDGTAGTYVAYATIPAIFTATDVTIYGFAGDAGITTQQACMTGTSTLPTAVSSYYPPYSGLTTNAVSSGPTGVLGSSAPTIGTGKIGNAMTTSGSTNSYMTAAGLGQKATYTSCMWVKQTAHVSGFGDSFTGDNDGASTWDAQNLLMLAGPPTHFSNGATDISGNAYWATGTSSPTTATWYHVCGVMSAGVSNKIYVNGSLETTTSLSGVTVFTGGTSTLKYGGRGADTNSSFAPAWNGLISDMLFSRSVFTAGQIANLYANQNDPGNFGGVAGAHFYDVSAIANNMTASWPYLPLNNTSTIVVTGSGTSWTGGTTFSVSGVSGTSLATQSITSGTVAVLTITTGNVTGTLTISDGTISTGVQVVSTGLQFNWGGPWRYNSKNPGATRNGDTILLAALDDGTYLQTCNDCYSGGSNLALSIQSADLATITLKNALTGFGAAGVTGLGICAAVTNGSVDGTVKSGPPLRRGKIIRIPVFCQQNGLPYYALNPSFVDTTEADQGAHVFREQDAKTTSAGSCAAGTVTLTMSVSPALSVGDWVIVHNVGVADDGVYQLTGGTSGTTLKYAATCTNTYTAGWAAGGTTTNTTNGLAWTSAITALGTFARVIPFQMCATGSSCGGPDSSDTYLYALVKSDSTSQDTLMRMPWADWDLDPNSYANMTFFDGTGFTQTSPLLGVCPLYYSSSGAISRRCTYGTNPIYMTDANLPDGGQYLVCNSYGQATCMIASHFTGPWYETNSNAISYNQNPPVATGIPSGNPRLYTAVGSSPYKGRVRVQVTGQYTDTVPRDNYSPFYFDVGLSMRDANVSPLFNGARTPGYAGYAGGAHVQKGLLSIWRFLPTNNFLTGPLIDEGPQQRDIPVSTGSADYPYQAISDKGLENPRSALNTYWPTNNMGGAWSVATTFTNSDLGSGDFTTAAVFASTASGTQVLLGPTQTGSVGFSWKIIGTAVHFIVRNASSIDVTCPGTLTANTMTAYIGIRYSGVGYCFRYGTTAAVSGGSDSASLGAYTLWLGSEADGTKHYFDGTVGTIAVWNRALCSTQIAGTCTAGQADEVIGEFSVLAKQGMPRGWALAAAASSNSMTWNSVNMTWNSVTMTWN